MINFEVITKPYIKELFSSIKEFVKIPSFYDEKTINNDMPYGKGIYEILLKFAELGKKEGFNVKLAKKYVELTFGDKGPIIEIFGHLDIVPPFNDEQLILKEDEKNIYGRGVADDKGPFLASFYAIKALKENNLINKNVRIKIFAGSDEERGSFGLKDYVNVEKSEIPTYGFTPDGSFPIIYAEKGCSDLLIKKNTEFKNIISIYGGIASNVVIEECTFEVKNINEIKNKINAKHKIVDNKITFIGKAFHGSCPSLGENAFLIGLKELGTINNDIEMINLYENFIDYSGKKMNAYGYGKCLGETTYNIGKVDFSNKELILSISFRYPEIDNPKDLVTNLLNKLNFKLVNANFTRYLIHDKNSKLVKLLVDAYHKETNDYDTPLVKCSGETFAKYCPNVIAFGAEFPNTNSNAHEKNEFFNKNNLIKAMIIYAHAIYNLINDASKI